MRAHWLIARRTLIVLLGIVFLCLGAFWYHRSVQAEQQRDIIREVVFRDAMARFSRLVPPKPGEQYILYEPDGAPVSAGLVQRLRDVTPRVVTGGDPEFIVDPHDHTFMIGDIEDDGPSQTTTWVSTFNRSNGTKKDGITTYTLRRSGGHWVVAERKFTRL